MFRRARPPRPSGDGRARAGDAESTRRSAESHPLPPPPRQKRATAVPNPKPVTSCRRRRWAPKASVGASTARCRTLALRKAMSHESKGSSARLTSASLHQRWPDASARTPASPSTPTTHSNARPTGQTRWSRMGRDVTTWHHGARYVGFSGRSAAKRFRNRVRSRLRNAESRPRRTGSDLRKWWRGLDLNQRPSGYEPDELPDCSTPRRAEDGTRPSVPQPTGTARDQISPRLSRSFDAHQPGTAGM